MLGVLFRDDGEVADLISIVALEIFERILEIFRDFSRGCSGERASWRSGRHDDNFTRGGDEDSRC